MFDLVLQGERAKKTIDEEFSSTASQRLGIKKIEKNRAGDCQPLLFWVLLLQYFVSASRSISFRCLEEVNAFGQMVHRHGLRCRISWV